MCVYIYIYIRRLLCYSCYDTRVTLRAMYVGCRQADMFTIKITVCWGLVYFWVALFMEASIYRLRLYDIYIYIYMCVCKKCIYP